MQKLKIAVLAITATVLIQGCSTEKSRQEAANAANEARLQMSLASRQQELQEIQAALVKDRSREWASSWERTQRGGAALRPPSYEHVLGTDRLLQDRAGPMYPELQPKPVSVIDQYMQYGPTGAVAYGVKDTQPAIGRPDQDECKAILDGGFEEGGAIVSARRNVPAYLAVKQKLCRGQQRLTYAEWETLVNGTPKDLPLNLQFKGYKP